MISLRFMLSFQFAWPKRTMLSITCFRVSRASTVFALWMSLNSRSVRIVNEDNPWMSGSRTRWKAKSTDLFFLDSRSQISSFTIVAVRYLQFAGGGYFSPRSFTESCDNSPVKILFTRPAIFSSMFRDCLVFGSNAWVRLSRKSLFVPSPGREMLGWDSGLWPLLESSKWFVAVVYKSSKLGIPSVTASLSSSFGSGCRRMSSLRLLKASVWLSKLGRVVEASFVSSAKRPPFRWSSFRRHFCHSLDRNLLLRCRPRS